MKTQHFLALVVLSLASVPGARAAVRGFKAQTLGLLTLVCLLAAAPATAQVNYGVSVSGTAYVDYSPNASGNIIIASTFNGFPVTSIGNNAFIGTGLTSVSIPNSVTSIGQYAFKRTGLTSVTIPNSVTSIQIGSFSSCTGLTSIIIPNSVTSIGHVAFESCTSLTSVIIGNSVASIGHGAFQFCHSLTNVIFGNSVTSIEAFAFLRCTSLTGVTIPSSVTSIGNSTYHLSNPAVFYGCTSLTNLSVDAANPALSSLDGVLFNKAQTALLLYPPGRAGSYVIPPSVTSIGSNAFDACTGLTSVTMANSVTSIGASAFATCTGLTSMTLGNSATNIGSSAFFRCLGLTSVTIPDSVTSIGSSAFDGCTSLTRVTIPDSVTRIGHEAFMSCTKVTNFTFLGNAPALIPYPTNSLAGRWFFNVGAGAKAYYHCGTTGWGANYGGLPTEMLCPPQVNYAISGDTAYVELSPNASGDIVIASTFNGFPVTRIRTYAFSHCTNLTSVTIPDSVTVISDLAFTNCTSLTSAMIGNNVRIIGSYAFSRCTNLTRVVMGNSVTNIGYRAFYTCASLTSVTIPNSVTIIGADAFNGCTSLTNLSVEAANPVYSSLDGVLFNKAQTTLIACPRGRGGSYVIPGSVTSLEYRQAFSGCIKLRNVTIGNSVTSIGDFVFFNCTSLTSVTIGNSVTSISGQAFALCNSLTNFTFLGHAPWLVDGAVNNVGAGAKAYYYCGTTGWEATLGNLPTVMLCPPGIAPGSTGMKPGGFGFTLTRLTNQTVVEASADLVNWQPIWTNFLPGASADFVDPEWLLHSNRFYRARSE